MVTPFLALDRRRNVGTDITNAEFITPGDSAGSAH